MDKPNLVEAAKMLESALNAFEADGKEYMGTESYKHLACIYIESAK